MKKKTVITTETREVWVIHRPDEANQETEAEAVPPPRDSEGDKESLAVPVEQPHPEKTPHLENE